MMGVVLMVSFSWLCPWKHHGKGMGLSPSHTFKDDAQILVQKVIARKKPDDRRFSGADGIKLPLYLRMTAQ
jgi:hypothetical protein